MTGDGLPEFALSIRQPWAWAILTLGKDVENRQWRTSRRGPIALHASQGCTRSEYEDFLATVHQISRSHPFAPGLVLPPLSELPRGGIVGVANLTGCVTSSSSPWFFGDYGLLFAEVRPVPFIAVKGALGFFRWRDRIVK